MAEPRPAREGADVGGMASTADAGLERATQRSMESADADPVGPASTGNASGGAEAPRTDLGGKEEPGSAGGARAPTRRPAADDRAAVVAGAAASASPRSPGGNRSGHDDDEDEWRHPPVAPVDEGPLESLGKAVGDPLTGSVDSPGVKEKAGR